MVQEGEELGGDRWRSTCDFGEAEPSSDVGGGGVEVGSCSHEESETNTQVRARAGECMFPSFRRKGSPYA